MAADAAAVRRVGDALRAALGDVATALGWQGGAADAAQARVQTLREQLVTVATRCDAASAAFSGLAAALDAQQPALGGASSSWARASDPTQQLAQARQWQPAVRALDDADGRSARALREVTGALQRADGPRRAASGSAARGGRRSEPRRPGPGRRRVLLRRHGERARLLRPRDGRASRRDRAAARGPPDHPGRCERRGRRHRPGRHGSGLPRRRADQPAGRRPGRRGDGHVPGRRRQARRARRRRRPCHAAALRGIGSRFRLGGWVGGGRCRIARRHRRCQVRPADGEPLVLRTGRLRREARGGRRSGPAGGPVDSAGGTRQRDRPGRQDLDPKHPVGHRAGGGRDRAGPVDGRRSHRGTWLRGTALQPIANNGLDSDGIDSVRLKGKR